MLDYIMKWLFIVKVIDHFVTQELSKHYAGEFIRKGPGTYMWGFNRSGYDTTYEIPIPNIKHRIWNRHLLVQHGEVVVNDTIDAVLVDREFNKTYKAILESFEYEIINPRYFSIDGDGVMRKNIDGNIYIVDDQGEIIEEQKEDLGVEA